MQWNVLSGAMVHQGHIAMEPTSEAASAARYSVNMHDERAGFCMAFTGSSREAGTIVDASHSFDDDEPVVKRCWTDAAPKFVKAGRIIRATRQLAHYKSAPYCPQANGRAERFNRLMIEGARCLLLQSGFGETRWLLAIVLFCMNFDAFYRGPDGLTFMDTMIRTSHKFRPYTFGAFVFVHPTDAPYPGRQTRDSLAF